MNNNKKISYAMAKQDPRYLSVSVNGNKKLVNNDNTRFIIWNIPAITTCPYATDACKKACYALKAEIAYPNTKRQRARNFEATKRDSFVSDMIYTIETELSRPINKGKKIIVRIHESGDFYNKKYTLAWLEIARHFLSNENVVFMAYTKSFIYFVGEKRPANFELRASVWDDTSDAQKE